MIVLAYAFISAVSAYIAQFHRPFIVLRLIIKPAPLILLAIWYRSSIEPVALYGLVFSSLGDVLLVPMNRWSALLGVLSFTVAQVLYIFNFGLVACDITALALFVSWSTVIYVIMAQVSQLTRNIKLVLSIYIAMLSIMLLSGIYTQSTYAMLGAVLFTFSDGMIAYKAIRTVTLHNVLIMSTYYAAQISIIYWSAVQQKVHEKSL